MKSLSLAKPLVIVMIGLPGSGKSFFARQFSETFSAPVISYNRLWHALYDNPLYSKEEQAVIQRIADDQLGELLKTQKTFLVDGGGNSRAQRMELRKRIRGAGYDVLLVWVQTDTATAQYRAMKRSARRTDDAHTPSLTTEQYRQLAKQFHPPAANETSVVVSGKHTYATQARIVLKKLVGPRTEHVNNQYSPGRADRVPEASDRPKPRGILIR